MTPPPAPAAWGQGSLATAEDALFGGALVSGAEADQQTSLFILLLLLHPTVTPAIRHFPPRL